MTLGEVIKQFREKEDMSQRQFALKCNVSNGYISMLEKGKNPKTDKPIETSLPTLKAIASTMGMSLNDLLTLVDDDISIDLSGDYTQFTEKNKPADKSGHIEFSANDKLILEILAELSDSKKEEAIRYLRYLATQPDKQ